MASVGSYNSAMQLIGLGGAGVNILEAFINNRRELIPLAQEGRHPDILPGHRCGRS